MDGIGQSFDNVRRKFVRRRTQHAIVAGGAGNQFITLPGCIFIIEGAIVIAIGAGQYVWRELAGHQKLDIFRNVFSFLDAASAVDFHTYAGDQRRLIGC